MSQTPETTRSAVLRCAIAPTAEELTDLCARFERLLGHTVCFAVEVDASLIGGYVALIAGKLYDFSVASRLQQVKKELERP